ncbi:MAG TPA: class I SAM-dependent methyltransferase [Bacteroidota bacterium]|nr:class I SAM-dependent methyltransferase [Bacteroidota bacterium]
MRRELSDCRTCLDIGCGSDSPVRFLRFDYSLGVEAYEPLLREAQRNGTHSEYMLANATELDRHFSSKQFDCCVAIDLIEHLTKDDGLKLISSMERIAARKVLLFTPNGFLPQRSHHGDLQEHLSGWTADEFERLGFRVYGMLGWKALRGEYHQHRFRLKRLSGVLSLLSHLLYTRRHPQHAAALLCVKSVGPS